MKVNMLENIFTNMPAYQSEVVYKYGQITVKIKRCHIDEYSINIDSGNLDLYNRYTIFYSNFIDLKPRIEFDNNYKKNGYWYIIENNHYFEDSWENGDIFTSKQINCILNAVKNTVEFIEQNGGAIINKTKLITKEEMLDMLNNKKILPAKVSLLQWERKLEKIKSERLTECFRDTTCALCRANDNNCNTCSLLIIGNCCQYKDSVWKSVYGYDGGDHEELVKRTEKMIEVLKKAVKYEEQHIRSEEVYYAGKMKITLIPTIDNKYKVKIDGIKCFNQTPSEYHLGGYPRAYTYEDHTMYIAEDGDNYLVSLREYIDNIIRTHEEAMKIVECLKKCSDRLHNINESKIEVTNIGKMVLKAKKVENDVYQCSIEGMKYYDELPHEYTENVSIIHCCVFRNDNRFTIINKYYNSIYFSLYSGVYDSEYLPIENFKVTKEELDELKRLLQICSDNLHRINNTTSIEVSNTSSSSKKEKMKIKVTQTDNNKVILEITGMKDDIFSINEDYRNRYSKYKNGILLGEMSEYFIPDGCDIDDCSVILLGKDHPMTKKCADEIITFLGASAAKLHAINHKDENYELEL